MDKESTTNDVKLIAGLYYICESDGPYLYANNEYPCSRLYVSGENALYPRQCAGLFEILVHNDETISIYSHLYARLLVLSEGDEAKLEFSLPKSNANRETLSDKFKVTHPPSKDSCDFVLFALKNGKFVTKSPYGFLTADQVEQCGAIVLRFKAFKQLRYIFSTTSRIMITSFYDILILRQHWLLPEPGIYFIRCQSGL